MSAPTVAIMVDEAGPSEGGEFGTPPILIDEHYDCPDCGKVHLLEECPECGTRDIEYGFGLGIGPGYGMYKICNTEGCPWFWKQALPHDQE